MLYFMFTVQDTCSGIHDRPWIARSEAEAIRAFGDIAVSADHPIGQHPEHYHLYRIASFDDNTGKVEACVPTHVIAAKDCVAQSQGKPIGGNGQMDVEDVTLDKDGYPLSGGVVRGGV